MLTKRLVCSVLIFCLLLSGCASRESAFSESQEIYAVEKESEGSSGFGDVLITALALGALITVAALFGGIGGSNDKDERSHHRHR